MRVFAAGMLAVFVAVGCSGPANDVFGADLYSSSCAHCHGSDLAGGIGPALGPGSTAAPLTDQQIIDVLLKQRQAILLLKKFTHSLTTGSRRSFAA